MNVKRWIQGYSDIISCSCCGWWYLNWHVAPICSSRTPDFCLCKHDLRNPPRHWHNLWFLWWHHILLLLAHWTFMRIFWACFPSNLRELQWLGRSTSKSTSGRFTSPDTNTHGKDSDVYRYCTSGKCPIQIWQSAAAYHTTEHWGLHGLLKK